MRQRLAAVVLALRELVLQDIARSLRLEAWLHALAQRLRGQPAGPAPLPFVRGRGSEP